ncbi:MAG: TRAP transporter large permease [Spirochaetes bacterium]|nr:TRAP transporter large permease [Spirochaetota bacterium]
MGYLIFGTFFLFLLIGVPIGLSIGLAALVVFIQAGIPLQMVPQTLFEGNNSFSLVAVPFFILAGDVLARGGISERIVAFAESCLGRIRGGLSIVSVLASMFIAAISGSGAATTAAVGASLLPELEERKYDVDFSAALIASAGTIGVVIPPSVPMVLYAVIAGESVAKLFLGGFIPGILMGLGLIIWAFYIAKKRNYPAGKKYSAKEIWHKFITALWGLMCPGIILGGIFSGVFTPSEAAAIAVVYTLLVAIFVYKALDFKHFYKLVVGSGITSALVMFIIATSKVFGWGLAFYQIPQAIAGAMLSVTHNNSLLVYLMIDVIILISGMFMETASALIILTPIFLPAIVGVGGNLVHFGVVLTVGLAIGMATPPVAIDIYVASAITGLPMGRITKPILPMVFILIVVFLLITFVPQLVMLIPGY